MRERRNGMQYRKIAEQGLGEILKRTNSRRVELLGAGPRHRCFDATALDRLMERGVRMMWVAAHPDDESFGGAIFAKQSLNCRSPLSFVVLTRGEGGECLLPCGRREPLRDIRTREIEAVARLYGAELTLGDYFNASLPVESFPYRHELARRWQEHTDPVHFIAAQIRAFRPDVLITFAPDYGSTGHPEHQLASRFATAAVRHAASEAPLPHGPAHHVRHVYYLLNKYWFTRGAGMGFDPLPYSELFPVRQPASGGLSCAEVMAEHTRPHHTQAADMGMMRKVAGAIHYLYLYRVDPFCEVTDPFQRHFVRGMG
jgi:LmbE family N-acetylglucosaminyl deacetylase